MAVALFVMSKSCLFCISVIYIHYSHLPQYCLLPVFQMYPGLKHLNIGQVPKVKVPSLTVMMSHLKFLLTLNLTGLQAVSFDLN